MSFEINPVLAGKYDVPEYTPARNYASATNIAAPIDITGKAAVPSTASVANDKDISGPDSRRYTQFDRSITDAGETTDFTFDDFLDLINPLEHIPIVSSIYRSITGEQIHPVARVAGDILYGGLLGAASAVLGGVGAIADAGLEAETGKDSGGLVVAALFGDDDKINPLKDDGAGSIRLADAGSAATNAKVAAPVAETNPPAPTTQNIEIAQAATPTPLLAAFVLPAGSAAPTAASVSTAPPAAVALSSAPPASAPTEAVQTATAPQINANSPTLSADLVAAVNGTGTAPKSSVALAAPARALNKLPYGGVINPTAATQAQDLALALAQGTPGMRMGHMIYTNKLMNGSHPLPPMLSSGGGIKAAIAPVMAPAPVAPAANMPVSSVEPGAVQTVTMAATGNAMSMAAAVDPMPAPLLQGMMLKALGQYGATANARSMPGSSVNIMN